MSRGEEVPHCAGGFRQYSGLHWNSSDKFTVEIHAQLSTPGLGIFKIVGVNGE